jgi:hypothetical protein
MPRNPTRDYADRCCAVDLRQQGLRQGEIAQVQQRPVRWVRRTFARAEVPAGLASLHDRSSRPQHSPRHTPTEIEQAICELKQMHPAWGRRQIAKQLRWRWRADGQQLQWISEGGVRCVLARHPELHAAAPPAAPKPAPDRLSGLKPDLGGQYPRDPARRRLTLAHSALDRIAQPLSL